MAVPLPFSENVEAIPFDEAEDIERTIAVMKQLLRQQHERSGRYQRDVHVKAHCCARGQLQVPENLPPELAQGLFSQPQTYPAFVRFSNSAPWAQSDAVPDGRGMAIQVENVEGETLATGTAAAATQDFVMVNHPVFIAKEVKSYLRIEEARLQASTQPVQLLTRLLSGALNPCNWPWREALAVARVGAKAFAHPATYTYYSMAPIRYGNYVAKYRVLPSAAIGGSRLREVSSFALQKNAMRALLLETLQREELKFDVQVQLRTSEISMPVENATIEWPEQESPYRTVAQLLLPRQDCSLLDAEGERRSFNVWNALSEHRPLGGINRVRRPAYALSAGLRSQQQQAGP